MNYKIQKGVKMPPHSEGRIYKYPFKEMEVGDSFSAEKSELMKVRGSAYAFASRNGVKFTVKETEDGCRCWRTK